MACLDKKSVEHIVFPSRVYWPCFYCHKYHRVFFILFIANSCIVCISTMTEYWLRMFCSDTQSANQCLHSVFIISFKWTFYPCTLIPKELKIAENCQFSAEYEVFHFIIVYFTHFYSDAFIIILYFKLSRLPSFTLSPLSLFFFFLFILILHKHSLECISKRSVT